MKKPKLKKTPDAIDVYLRRRMRPFLKAIVEAARKDPKVTSIRRVK